MGASDKYESFKRFCEGVRAIAPGIEIHLKPSEKEKDHWSIQVCVVGGASYGVQAILFYTDFMEIDAAIAQGRVKLAGISTRMMAVLREVPPSSSVPPPPSSSPLSPPPLPLPPPLPKIPKK